MQDRDIIKDIMLTKRAKKQDSKPSPSQTDFAMLSMCQLKIFSPQKCCGAIWNIADDIY